MTTQCRPSSRYALRRRDRYRDIDGLPRSNLTATPPFTSVRRLRFTSRLRADRSARTFLDTLKRRWAEPKRERPAEPLPHFPRRALRGVHFVNAFSRELRTLMSTSAVTIVTRAFAMRTSA